MMNLLVNHRRIEDAASAQLNMLRGLSAIAVLLGHGVQTFIAPIYPPLLAWFGLLAQAAVMLFFVLSGLLITKSITRNSSQPGGFDLRAFAGDRFDRIYPPFLLAMLVVPALLLLTPYLFPTGTSEFAYSGGFIVRSGFDVDLNAWLGSLVFVNGFLVPNISANGPLWSLSYEVWYYVIAGLIAWRPRIGMIAAAALMLALGALNKAFVLYSAIWFAGALIAILHNRQIRRPRLAWTFLAASLAAALMMGGYYVHLANQAAGPETYPALPLIAFNLLWGAASAVAVYLMMIGAMRLKPVAQGTARFSYTLYVTHFPLLLAIYGTVQAWIHDDLLLSAVTAGASCLFVLAVAWIAAPFVENIKWAGRLAANSAVSPRGVAARD